MAPTRGPGPPGPPSNPRSVLRLLLDRYERIVVLTGAGISVASGLRPFRGPGGIWDDEGLERFATAEALADDPRQVWKAFGPMRPVTAAAEPNAAHRALAEAEQRLGRPLFVLTQNIDGLHARAGSRHVVELHGNIMRTRCTACDLPPFEDHEPHVDDAPLCPRCGSYLRPDILLFHEPFPPEVERDVRRSLFDSNLFLAVGTSGTVWPAAGFVQVARADGARTVLVNLEDLEDGSDFDEIVLGRAEEVLPRLLR